MKKANLFDDSEEDEEYDPSAKSTPSALAPTNYESTDQTEKTEEQKPVEAEDEYKPQEVAE
jgi:hypothetical protein